MAQGNQAEVGMSGRQDDGDPTGDWMEEVGTAEGFEEFAEIGDLMASGGPAPAVGPAPIASAPMIIDSDVGGDPDDTVALVVAALRVPELKLVITSDEYGGERARFARFLLDLVGRPEVKVVAGSDLGNSRLYFVDGLFPADVPKQGTDVVGAIAEACALTPGQVRWVGMGPLSNLSTLQSARPELVAKLAVTQMGGAIVYRKPDRAEHNFREDPEAAIRMLPVLELWGPRFVVSDVTFNPAMELTADSPIYKRWAEPDAPAWAKVLKTHNDRWMERFPGSMQHDGLTLAAALLWPGIRFARERVVLDPIARMTRSDEGTEIDMASSVDYSAFMSWLDKSLAFD